MTTFATPGLAALITSLLVCLLILKTRGWHGALSMDLVTGIQRQHRRPTPRIGGLSIWLALGVGTLFIEKDPLLAPSLWLVGTPIFIVGLVEDLSKSVSVGVRLVTSMTAGLVGWWLTGYTLNALDWPLVDAWLSNSAALAVGLSCFAVAGVTNALNIVDGFNGIAGGTAIIIAGAFLYLAQSTGDTQLVGACWVLIAALTGFLLFNWPRGTLFLGDGGAYLTGCALGWLAVMLNTRHAGISAWTVLLVCAYPIQEVLFSIWRRRYRHRHWGQPDRLHLHSLVGRRLIRFWAPHASPLTRNSLTGLAMLTANALPVVWALSRPGDKGWQIAGFVLFALGYRLVYRRLCRFGWHNALRP